jgi:hypothetical protein
MQFEYLNRPVEPSHESLHFDFYEMCGICRTSTDQGCKGCGERRCHHCLFPNKGQDGKPVLLCLICTQQLTGEPPSAWYYSLSMPFVAVSTLFAKSLRPGASFPAGGGGSWYQPPRPEKVMHWFYTTPGGQEMSVFELASLSAWLLAWSTHLAESRAALGGALLAGQEASREAARLADSYGSSNPGEF